MNWTINLLFCLEEKTDSDYTHKYHITQRDCFTGNNLHHIQYNRTEKESMFLEFLLPVQLQCKQT